MSRTSVAYPPSFYMYLKDPSAHWEMIEDLENRYKVEECSFNNIFGSFEVLWIIAGRKVAEKIEMKPDTQPSFITYMSGRINGIWPRKTSSHTETGTSSGSRLLVTLYIFQCSGCTP